MNGNKLNIYISEMNKFNRPNSSKFRNTYNVTSLNSNLCKSNNFTNYKINLESDIYSQNLLKERYVKSTNKKIHKTNPNSFSYSHKIPKLKESINSNHSFIIVVKNIETDNNYFIEKKENINNMIRLLNPEFFDPSFEKFFDDTFNDEQIFNTNKLLGFYFFNIEYIKVI
jgi:hypothetical protein